MPLFLSYFLIFFLLASISLKDIKDGIILDILLVMLGGLGVFWFGGTHTVSVLILGVLSYSLYRIFLFVKGQEGLGLGDVKMMVIAGIWLDPFHLPLFLILTGAGGISTALIWRFLNKGPRFPLGPALAFALGICIVGHQGLSKGETHMHTFSGPHLPPASGGAPDSLVVFIHGYGADGKDLLSLGKVWAPLLPHTLFVAPHGPVICEINPSGHQWFGLRDWDPARILKEIQSITPAFNQYLDKLLQDNDLPPEKLALVGFSQGAMLALHVALHRPVCGGVIAYSGGFFEDPHEMIMARPPVLLIHGLVDQIVPSSFSQMAESRLKALGVPVTLSLFSALDHGIDSRGVEVGGSFLRSHLYESNLSGL